MKLKKIFKELFCSESERKEKEAELKKIKLRIKKEIHNFLIETRFNKIHQICNVEFDLQDEIYNIKITTLNPSVLIGNGGKYVKRMQQRLKKNLGKKIFIKINEPNLWN